MRSPCARRLVLVPLLALVAVPAAPAAAAPTLRPRESLAAFSARFTQTVAALQRNDCATVARIGRGTGLTCAPYLRNQFRGFRELRYQQFGTGAVMDYVVDRGRPTTVNSLLALGPDRRFQTGNGLVLGSGAGIRQIGTRATPASARLFQRTAEGFVRSLQERDCGLLFRTVFAGGQSRARVCSAFFSTGSRSVINRRTAREVAAVRSARPVATGGTRDLQFFRLRLGTRHYYTLFVARTGRRGAALETLTLRVY